MFDTLSERLSGVFDKLTKHAVLSQDDVAAALREVRIALLEADVSLPIVRDFIRAVGDKAKGQAVTKSVSPAQQVVKIVHDELVHFLAGDDANAGELKIDNPPTPILMVGLQGSGKTTTTAKLAKYLLARHKKKILLASLDTNRPAAMEQLAILGTQVGVDTLAIVAGQTPVEIAKRAKQQAKLGGYDVYILDTAGRLHIDSALMDEVQAVRDIANPRETLLVVDGLTGQDAVNVAKEFDERLDISGVILTRMDGDGRGGAALSMRAVTGCAIKFVGLGEKLDALETFMPERIAGRILGMGDIVSLVEKAQETIEVEQAKRMEKRFKKGLFNMNDMKMQLEQMINMGGLGGVMGMMGGMKKISQQIEKQGINDQTLKHQIALIQSMTKAERANPKIMQASRKKRVAKGAGLSVPQLNQLLKMQRQMGDMMKKLGKGGMMKQAMSMMMGKGGNPMGAGAPDAQALAEASKHMQRIDEMPDSLPNNLPSGLSGFGGGVQLPPGLSGFGKKK